MGHCGSESLLQARPPSTPLSLLKKVFCLHLPDILFFVPFLCSMDIVKEYFLTVFYVFTPSFIPLLLRRFIDMLLLSNIYHILIYNNCCCCYNFLILVISFCSFPSPACFGLAWLIMERFLLASPPSLSISTVCRTYCIKYVTAQNHVSRQGFAQFAALP